MSRDHVRTPVVILDTETTGLPHHPWARVIELGAVALDADGVAISAFTSLVRPDVLDSRAEPALQVNNIQPHALRQAPSAAEVWADFCAWGNTLPPQADGMPYATTSWRVNFERRLISRTPGLGFLPFDYCLWEVVKSLRPKGKRNVHLGPLCEELGIDDTVYGPKHRALTDARIAGAVLRKLLTWPAGEPFLGAAVTPAGVAIVHPPDYDQGQNRPPEAGDDDIPF